MRYWRAHERAGKFFRDTKMGQFWDQHKDKDFDVLMLVTLGGFAIWVMGWQSAHLGAPTAAIASGAMAAYERHSRMPGAYRLAIALGLLATGFMWLLSTTEERGLAPANAIEGWIIITGWGITAATVVLATLATVLPTNYFTRIPKHPKRKLIADYTAGFCIPILVMIPTIAVLGIVETSIGRPGDLDESVPAMIFYAPVNGLVLTMGLRRKPFSIWRHPTDDNRYFHGGRGWRTIENRFTRQ